MREFLISLEDYSTRWFNPALQYNFRTEILEWLDTHCKNKYKLGTVDYGEKSYICILFDDDDDYVRFILEWN